MRVDWSKCSPHEIREAAQTMPLFAGPWVQSNQYRRDRSTGVGNAQRLVGQVCRRLPDDGTFFFIVGGGPSEDCASFEDGMAQVDARLCAEGWFLDDEPDDSAALADTLLRAQGVEDPAIAELLEEMITLPVRQGLPRPADWQMFTIKAKRLLDRLYAERHVQLDVQAARSNKGAAR